MKIAGKEVTGAIFDVDGTLLDSMPVWEQVGNEFLIRKGITPRENLAETFKTMSLQESAVYYQEQYNIKETKEEIIASINAMIREAYERSIPLKEGVHSVLITLKEQGIPLYIATATDRSLVLSALKRNGIVEFFKGIVTCEEIGKSKEYPDIYEKACMEIKSEKETTWVVEDAYHAAVTAKKAGFKVLAVYDSTEEEQEKLKKLADYYCVTLTKMRGVII